MWFDFLFFSPVNAIDDAQLALIFARRLFDKSRWKYTDQFADMIDWEHRLI